MSFPVLTILSSTRPGREGGNSLRQTEEYSDSPTERAQEESHGSRQIIRPSEKKKASRARSAHTRQEDTTPTHWTQRKQRPPISIASNRRWPPTFTHHYYYQHHQPSLPDLPPSTLWHIRLRPTLLFRTDATPTIQPASQIPTMHPFEHSETDSELLPRRLSYQTQP